MWSSGSSGMSRNRGTCSTVSTRDEDGRAWGAFAGNQRVGWTRQRISPPQALPTSTLLPTGLEPRHPHSHSYFHDDLEPH